MADNLLARVRGDIAFIGCNGISVEGGVTNMNFAEGDMKRRMLHSAARRVVMADGSLTEVDLLITGHESNARFVDGIRNGGLEVLTV